VCAYFLFRNKKYCRGWGGPRHGGYVNVICTYALTCSHTHIYTHTHTYTHIHTHTHTYTHIHTHTGTRKTVTHTHTHTHVRCRIGRVKSVRVIFCFLLIFFLTGGRCRNGRIHSTAQDRVLFEYCCLSAQVERSGFRDLRPSL